ncbi:CoA-disulfide reductase [Bacillus sp. AFS076308]|uniref:CoA-disulfide reductase n=1 Tax=unclassified Bacillus (in: firmicutes) TaxID=185979 RepID=UPI000BFA5EFD|nr:MULTISPECIES: CoA-disulfide reductase [unclassified Bacillus (in: firmicutes)]PFN98162.1 CoA-disulfide reductase [Bacillus sp. AFS076308]PGV50877.1 CoA-disulfide reductase [Bacillus sp. AFS037270]
MTQKIIIIGGVAGGATAAARLRRISEDVEIILVERGEHISFANCGLPYYIGETIKDRNKLLVQTVKGMSDRFNLDIRNLSEVLSIDPENKSVIIKDLKTGEAYEESYDKLLLSPGARPIVPPILGLSENQTLFTLRNIPDTDKIKTFVDTQNPQKAIVVGGGFIGIEMAENLVDRGLEVTIIEMANQIMAPIDFEMASILHTHLKEKGVKLILENGVQSFTEQGKRVLLSDGTEIATDMTILSIGVRPENELAKIAGLELGNRGGIVVNEYLQTSNKDIYAVGDAVEVVDYISGTKSMIPLAGPANRQGRIAANNMMGKNEKYQGTMGTSIAKVFDLTVAATGNNEKILKRLGVSYEVIHIHPSSHAGYYPGAAPIALKLIFDKETGKIFGAQAVGSDGVDKRIDVIATAIKGGLTVEDLTNLELSYAPPYSSAKDPVNMAGYVAFNIIEGEVETIQWHEVDNIVSDGGLLIDVREPMEREFGFIKGSINISLNDLRNRLEELPKDQTIYVSCQVGLRGYIASRILKNNGYDVKNVDGGWKTYSSVFGSNLNENFEANTNNLGETDIENSVALKVDSVLDVSGLVCPMPIVNLKKGIAQLESGQILELHVTDRGALNDLPSWTKNAGHTILKTEQTEQLIKFWIEKN